MTDKPLYRWFADSAGAYPDLVALEVGDSVVTYDELGGLADRLATRLIAEVGGAPTAIGVLASRTLAAYVAYLAGLRCNATVVPLGPTYPYTRNLHTCRSAGLAAVIADESGAEQAGKLAAEVGIAAIDLSDPRWTHSLPPAGALPTGQPAMDDTAYVLFTSGSTGVPKGVPVAHSAISCYLDYQIPRYEVTPGCRWIQNAEITFDLSVLEIFATWGAGATVVVPSRKELLAPVQFVRERAITHWLSVPSVASYARRMRMLTPGSMPTMRMTSFGGEPLTVEQAAAWHAAAPHSRIENLYGPTETTISCTTYWLPDDPADWPPTPNGTLPLGAVFDHLEWCVLDEDGRPTDDGELCIRGPQRFAGYLEPENNPGRFHTFDGTQAVGIGPGEAVTPSHWYRTGDRILWHNGHMIHYGRLDHQVKVRGYRIELGEIEQVLRGHPGVQDAVVLAIQAGDGDSDLVAAYTGTEVPARDLMVTLAAAVPPYMMPRRYQYFAEFPANANRKVDRGALTAIMAQPG